MFATAPLLLSLLVVPLTLHPQVFATASTDTTIKLWDMRALSSSKGAAPKPLATGGHPQACQAALFAPDGAWMGGGLEGGGCITWLAAAVHHCPSAAAAAAVATHPLPSAPQACAAWCQSPFATPHLLMSCVLLPYHGLAGSRRLVSTSFDNTCRVWDGAAGMQQLLAIQHDNQT